MPKRIIRVFLATPGDLTAERRAFKKEIDFLNLHFGDGADVEFVPLGWEDTLASTGRRTQAVIDRDINQCDVFILAMWRRWGQDAPDVAPCNSYTEHEFHLALDRFNKTKSPEIFVFFKDIDPGQMADPGEQLKKVLTFRLELEKSKIVLYRNFADETGFAEEVSRHLRAFARDELPPVDESLKPAPLPIEVVRRVEEAEARAEEHARRAEAEKDRADEALAHAEAMTLELARRAAGAALEGRIEEARQDFAKATASTRNLVVLSLATKFYFRIGEFTTVATLLQRWLDIAGPYSETADTAAAYGNLGNIYSTRGDLDRAEEFYNISLAIEEKLGRLEGMADQYGNLGVLNQTRGDLDRAEEFYNKALAIDEKLGRLEGMANQYGNLGTLYQTRGDLDRAEEFYNKSLAINEKLGRLGGMAIQYGNLGVIFKTRGDLDRAEEFYLKALAINEKLRDLEGMASDYGNLGVLYRTRGDLDRAEDFYNKALAIEEKLGRLDGMASDYGNLGTLYQTRGDLDRAEEFYNKSLAINDKLGSPEGMAIQYANLGTLYLMRNDIPKAREHWTKARDLFVKAQMPHKATQMQEWLDDPEAEPHSAPPST